MSITSNSPQSIQPENVDSPNSLSQKPSETEFEALVELLGIDSDIEDEAENAQQLGVERLHDTGNLVGDSDSGAPDIYLTQENQLERTFDANRHVDESDPSIHQLFPSENVEDLIDLSNKSPLWNHASTELPLRESASSSLHTQTQISVSELKRFLASKKANSPHLLQRSSELTSIKAALDLAHRETDELRKRCRELESLLPRSRLSEAEADRYLEDTEAPPSLSPDNLPRNEGMHERKVPDIDNMSLPQARSLLKLLIETFSLSIPDVQREAQHELQGRETISYLAPQTTLSLSGVRRSIEFVSYVDELVWRRSRLGSKYDNPYCEDNIQALKDRVDLWERIIRTSR